MSRALTLALLGTCLWIAACAHPKPVKVSSRYRAHTLSSLSEVAQFERLCAPGTSRASRLEAVKFVITDFQAAHSPVHFLDGHFYTFHDEWLWYQVLNGIPVGEMPGLEDSPGFDTPEIATAWARHQTSLPIDLRFVEDRMYSDGFYVQAMSEERSLGVGALVQIPASDTRKATWGFELEYTDVPSVHDVERFHRKLRQALPPEIARDLHWLTRSTAQAQLAARMRKASSAVPTLDYADLASAGESEVYGTGLRVGRLLLLDEQRSAIAQSTTYDVLVAPRPLDDLPPAAGLISLVPLTPLSHFNVLARQRGIPSVYVGGLAEDPFMGTLIKARAPVLLDARADGVWLSPMSEDEYRTFGVQETVKSLQPSLPDVQSMPYVRDLRELVAQPALVRLAEVGGKSLGFVTLAALPEEQRPDPVAVITVRAYAEHIAKLEPTLRKLLENPWFLSSERVRFLALEGRRAFTQEFPSETDRAWAASFEESSGVLAEVIAQGGVQAMLRAVKLDERARAEIERALGASFARLPPTQGLRFRSSSTLEDIPGFNGAGLYDSNTGYLQPGGKRDDIETALEKTWGSYWNFRAFEERRRAQIDSLAGRMAVVVHPKFDDDFELGNAVVTFTLYPPNLALQARMEVNAQHGSLSVTNPPSDNAAALPEVTRVELPAGSQALTIMRVRPSTEISAEARVFGDDDLKHVFAALHPLASTWLKARNAGSQPVHAARMATLDLELRYMAAPWPLGDSVKRSAPRWVVKQVRSLEPPAQIAGVLDMELPIPRDVLLRTVKLVRRTCKSEAASVELIEAYTGKDFEPDLGYSQVPFIASAMFENASRSLMLTHLDFAEIESRTRIELRDRGAASLGSDTLDVSAGSCGEETIAASLGISMHEIAARARPLGKLAK